MTETNNLRVSSFVPLSAPDSIKTALPIDDTAAETVATGRREISDVLSGRDDRMLAIVGPCSIHDEKAALEYARRLRDVREELREQLVILMRVYFEKPRTTLGWRGLILDPHLDGSYDIEEGLRRARKLLLDIAGIGLPAGSEVLDPIVVQYIADLVSWASIGARTTESQTHREMASGLSMPVGFKNGTDGDVTSALNAMASSASPHSFLGIDQNGKTAVVNTRGNSEVHMILRGGRSGPNYHSWEIVKVEELLRSRDLPTNIVVDCSHGNSQREPGRQPQVLSSIVDQRLSGRTSLRGFMIESNLVGGRQNLSVGVAQLEYGKSITDACLGWDETAQALRSAAARLGGES